MKKKLFLLIVAFMAMERSSFAYDFSAVAPSGQTLYYTYQFWYGPYVSVTYQSEDQYNYENLTGALTIPSDVTYNGTTYRVIDIGPRAFFGCRGLTSVTFPISVSSISYLAFGYCYGLASLTIPDWVTEISGEAFTGVRHIEYHGNATGAPWGAYYMNGVTDGDFIFSNSTRDTLISYVGIGGNVTIPNSVTSIGRQAFYGCSGLTSVTIGNSVTDIGDYAFENCSSLTSVTFGNSVTSIGDNAFSSCSSLTSVTIPNSVTSIGWRAFLDCSGLTSVTIGNSVTSIGNYAFYSCSSLTSVTFGNSVTRIGDYAFQYCRGLTSLTFLNPTPPWMGSDVFQGTLANILTVHVPCGSLTSYASLLSNFIHFDEVYTSLSVESVDVTQGLVQIVTMPSCTEHTAVLRAVPADGYLFSHWSTGATNNPYTVTVTEGMTIRAHFVNNGGHHGIRETEDNCISILVTDGRIHVSVEGQVAKVFRVHDMMGREVFHAGGITSETPTLPAGVYLVKVGDYPARKVVVIR